MTNSKQPMAQHNWFVRNVPYRARIIIAASTMVVATPFYILVTVFGGVREALKAYLQHFVFCWDEYADFWEEVVTRWRTSNHD